MNSRLEIPGGLSRYRIIDFLKGYSILTIVAMHLIQMESLAVPNFIHKAASFGGAGVHIFFLCSGFGLYLSQKKQHSTWKQFLKGRFFNIYIPYLIVVLISAFVPIMYPGDDRLEALLSHVFLYKMFIPSYEHSFGVQLWYLSTLFQLYLLFFPLCTGIEKLGRKNFLGTCCCISIVWSISVAVFGVSDIRIWSSFCFQYLWEFALGMVLADYLYSGKSIEIETRWVLLSSVIGTGIAAIAVLKAGVLQVFNDFPAFVGYGSTGLLLYSFKNKWIQKTIFLLSDISFEWYLVHILVFTCVFHIMSASGNLRYIIAVIAFFASIIVATLFHALTTRMKLKHEKRTHPHRG